MKNDYVSTTTDVVPEAVKAAGPAIVEEQTKKLDESKADESGEEAEIKAQDAVETEDIEADADDKDVDAGEDDQEKTDEEISKPKKKGGFQKKLERKDREIEQLREQLARQQQPQAQKPVEKTVDTAGKPEIDKFESQAEYLEALTDWKVEQKVKEAKLRQEFESTVNSLQAKISEFKKESADFDDVISKVDDIQLNYSLQEAIATSDLGPKLMYELARDRKTLERISSLPISKALTEIGRFEARISAPEEKKPEVKTKTAAPPPPKPVGTKSPGKVVKDPSEMSGDEYIAWKRGKK